jgi:hypothetical protein
MPHATNQYAFEWKIFEWAGRFSQQLTGGPHYPFLILLSPEGRVLQIHVGDAPEQHDDQLWQRLRQPVASWFVYDPFEGPVYTYIAWQNVSQVVLERLLGAPFAADSFAAQGEAMEFPTTWQVMF